MYWICFSLPFYKSGYSYTHINEQLACFSCCVKSIVIKGKLVAARTYYTAKLYFNFAFLDIKDRIGKTEKVFSL